MSVGGKVRAITVDGGTAIKAFRTSKDIGIGATVAALRAAHPGLATPLGPDNPSLGSGATMNHRRPPSPASHRLAGPTPAGSVRRSTRTRFSLASALRSSPP